MDTNLEDKMYHQIEKNLSSNINENLFAGGRSPEKDKLPMVSSRGELELTEKGRHAANLRPAGRQESQDDINQPPVLSRAELIRQARESCLRQLSNQSIRMMDAYSPENEDQLPEVINKKKVRAMRLFKDNDRSLNSPWDENPSEEANSPQEIASFQSLIIRTVCAIILFVGLFLIDKFNFSIGTFSKAMIREYVTGKDFFEKMEEIVVTWFK
jgi:hypothetical protein